MAQLLLRLDHFIFACDVPPPDAAKFPQAKEEMRQRYMVWGDVIGVSISITDIRGGFRIDAEATTEEAKRRLSEAGSAGATKVSISLRRIDRQIIADVTAGLRNTYGLMIPEPSAQDAQAAKENRNVGWEAPGKCHLL